MCGDVPTLQQNLARSQQVNSARVEKQPKNMWKSHCTNNFRKPFLFSGMRTTLPTAKISSHTAHGPPAVLTPISFNDSVIVAADSPRQRDHIFENIRRAWNDALPNVTNLEAKIFKDVAYVDAESPKGALLRSIQYTVSGMAQQVVSGEKARAKFREVAAKTPIQGVWSIAGANRMTVNGSFASLTDGNCLCTGYSRKPGRIRLRHASVLPSVVVVYQYHESWQWLVFHRLNIVKILPRLWRNLWQAR